MQSVPITTNVVISNPTQASVLDTTLCDIKFVNDMQQASDFLLVLVSSTNKTDRHDITEILLKVTLNTIKPTNRRNIDQLSGLYET